MLILRAIESEIHSVTEARLIKRAAAGESDAFEKLARSYESRIYAYALRILRNKEDAKDALQETLIKIYKNIGSFSRRGSFAAWVFRIARNTCLDILRASKPEQSLDALTEVGLVLPVTREEYLPEASAERMEQRRILAKNIDELPELRRALIILRDVDGYSYDQIAHILNISEGTVKSGLNRARRSLRDSLAESGVFTNTQNTGE